MSHSRKSKAESPSSPATGGESKSPSGRARAAGDAPDKVEVALQVSRQRWIGWAVGGLAGGVFLVTRLGTVGVWAGYVVIAIGLFRAYQLVNSLVHPGGTIVVTPERVSLPRGVHKPRPLELAPTEVTAVYFLRRSVPWSRSAPVLIVERGDEAMAFPRDWFASEADQRHVVHALLAHLPDVRREPDEPRAPSAAPTAAET